MRADKLHSIAVFTLLLCLAATSALFAQDNSRHTIPNSKLGFVSTAKDLGPEVSSKQVTIYVWLQLHNVDSLRELVEQQYDASSPNYQNWLTPEEFNSNYAPTSEDVGKVKAFLAAHNLSVSSVGDRNMYVKAQGTISSAQSAFKVQIHRFDVHGHTYRANTTDPTMEGPAGALVSRVGGLSDLRFQPHSLRAMNPQTGKPFPAVPLSATANGAFYSANCLQSPELVNFSTDGSSPKATYYGNTYGAPITNTTPGTLAPCGYQPSDLQTAYNLNGLYKYGLNGAGQTVVIVDAYGSPTIVDDATTFSNFYGLAPLNLSIYQPGGTPVDEGWAFETTLDVESSHAVAPGANIALVEAYTDLTDDLGAAILFAVDQRLGNVISNSYGLPESELGGTPYSPFDDILLVAAAHGISVDFSSGDNGDFYAVEGQTDVNYPASTPYATAVGGTSLFLNKNKTTAFETGWGNNLTWIANAPDQYGYSVPLVPPDNSAADALGFQYGAGGGTSAVYRKPGFQRGLPGRYRLVPDIAYLADPDTGMEVLCAGSSCFNIADSSLYVAVGGGTSLACPMFSGLWAIANQRSGHPLGQAARSIYGLSSDAINDITPVSSPFNVTGAITAGHHTTYESAYDLVAPLETRAPFLSALFDWNGVGWFVLSFGTDSSLSTNRGWDNVTGLGTPNGLEFVNAVASHR
jgi:subtilase family serine protease